MENLESQRVLDRISKAHELLKDERFIQWPLWRHITDSNTLYVITAIAVDIQSGGVTVIFKRMGTQNLLSCHSDAFCKRYEVVPVN